MNIFHECFCAAWHAVSICLRISRALAQHQEWTWYLQRIWNNVPLSEEVERRHLIMSPVDGWRGDASRLELMLYSVCQSKPNILQLCEMELVVSVCLASRLPDSGMKKVVRQRYQVFCPGAIYRFLQSELVGDDLLEFTEKGPALFFEKGKNPKKKIFGYSSHFGAKQRLIWADIHAISTAVLCWFIVIHDTLVVSKLFSIVETEQLQAACRREHAWSCEVLVSSCSQPFCTLVAKDAGEILPPQNGGHEVELLCTSGRFGRWASQRGQATLFSGHGLMRARTKPVRENLLEPEAYVPYHCNTSVFSDELAMREERLTTYLYTVLEEVVIWS